MKWVSVIALGLAGTLAVACGGDDDDDDNPGTQGSGGKSGSAGSAGSGSGSGGSAGGGMGASGAGGGGGGAAPILPPLEKADIEAAIKAFKYDPDQFDGAKPKWACTTDGDAGTSEVPFHNDDQDGEFDTRTCSNFNIAGVDYDPEDSWPIGAASVKETLDGNGDITEWSYYARKPDGSWVGARLVPDGDNVVATLGGCTGGGCHGPENTGADDWVIEADLVEKGDDPNWLPPNGYPELFARLKA